MIKFLKIPLPVVHISPPIAWRSESSGMILEEAILVLACTILIGQVKRWPYDCRKQHLYKVSAEKLISMGESLLKTPYVVSKPKQDRITTIKRKLDEQQKEIEELKQIVEKLQKPKTKKQKIS